MQPDERRSLEALGWASCQPGDAQPCWHHPYADLNDPFTTEQAIEYSARRDGRMLKCAAGNGPDWAGYPDEYDEQRLSSSERCSRASEARRRQGFPDLPFDPAQAFVESLRLSVELQRVKWEIDELHALEARTREMRRILGRQQEKPDD